MSLMYIINFKVFGYYLPFWRKMQTKLKVRTENSPGMCFLPLASKNVWEIDPSGLVIIKLLSMIYGFSY
jgi:hypothetical protein